jgi:type III restriction enzyme
MNYLVNIPAYKNQTITEINGYQNKIVVGGQDIYPGDILNDKDENIFAECRSENVSCRTCKKKNNCLIKGLKYSPCFLSIP